MKYTGIAGKLGTQGVNPVMPKDAEFQSTCPTVFAYRFKRPMAEFSISPCIKGRTWKRGART